MKMRTRVASWTATGVLLASVLVAGGGTVPVAAAETVTLPASGSLAIEGGGYGHGRGMSQWGAYGAAVSGLGHQQILAHYYPGTVSSNVGDPQLRVRITATGGDAPSVVATRGLTVSASGASLTLPASLHGRQVTYWRVVSGQSGLLVQGRIDSWTTIKVGGVSAHAGTVGFSSDSGRVRLVLGSTRREYRGHIEAVAGPSSIGTRVVTPMASYLRSVVPAEMPASWHPQAVRAQAVAARTYASWQRAEEPGPWYDTCDSTACQVFSGVADYTGHGELIRRYEHEASDAAVAATAGQILTHAGKPAFTQFSASNGGWTVAGSRPYLAAFADEYDGVVSGSPHRWSATITAGALQNAYPQVGRPTAIRIEARDGHGAWGGRITRLVVQGSAGSVEVTGEQFRFALGLRSSWWHPS